MIHYRRTDGAVADWGLHLFGDALAAGQATPAWETPTAFEGSDGYGVLHTVGIADDTKQVGFIVHGRPPGGDINTKDPTNAPDRFFTPATCPEIWLEQGDLTVHCSPPAL